MWNNAGRGSFVHDDDSEIGDIDEGDSFTVDGRAIDSEEDEDEEAYW